MRIVRLLLVAILAVALSGCAVFDGELDDCGCQCPADAVGL